MLVASAVILLVASSDLSQVDIGLGMEAGLAVVIVAVYLDRITNGLANRTPLARAQRAS